MLTFNNLFESKSPSIKIEKYTVTKPDDIPEKYHKQLAKLASELDENEQKIDSEYMKIWYSSNLKKDYSYVVNRWLKFSNKYDLYLLIDKDTLIGYIRCGSAKGLVDTVYLDDFCVAKSERGKGYGKILLNYVIKELKKSYKRIILDVFEKNEVAKKLYSSFGFRTVSNKMVNFE